LIHFYKRVIHKECFKKKFIKMVKSKKMQRGLADTVSKRKGGGVAKLNPFNIRTVKNKHQDVLGQKKKVRVGQPGIARERSIQIRKQTLLQ